MKILMVLEGEFPPDIRVENELKVLNDAGIKVVLACLTRKGAKRKEKKGEFLHIYRHNINPILFNFRINHITFLVYARNWAKFLSPILKKYDFDFIHAHDLPIFRVLHKIGLTKKYDVNLDLHENYPVAIQNYLWATKFPNNVIVMPKLWFKIEKKLLKHANKIIVLSEDYKEKLIKNYPYLKYEQFVIFPNVPDLTRFKQRTVQIGSSANSHNVVVLTYFGIISRRRGIHTAIKALKILINSGQNLKLLLIGPIDKKEKNQFSYYLDDLNLKNYIQHIKWIDLDDLPAYMGKTDICISPIIKNDQHESGVANKVFQYMTFGKPVIVSNCKPQAKIIEQEECGVVFDSENPADLAEKIKTLISNTELIKKMGKNAKKAILRKYNTKVMGENLLNIYRI